MKVAIIGAGPAGLASLKYAIDDGHNCDVFEQTGTVGGTFVYTDYTDFDENGIPVLSAMYKGLTINLPKETMAFSDFPYPEEENSFLGHGDVEEYYRNYTNHFNLQQYIQFYKCVTKVELVEETKWNVTVLDAKTKLEATATYDDVVVCNGHHSLTITPEIPGQDIFRGIQRHSHKYRRPEPYKDKIVLVIGTGPSGQDIGFQISSLAKHVFIVVSKEMFIEIPSNMTETSRVVRLLENKAVFEDGREEVVDVVLYCTGYKYSVPFLAENSGVEVAEKCIFPLFKHVVNIEHPTMFFIGLPFIAIIIPMLDVQARFAVAAIGKKFVLPSKEDMLKEFESEKAWRQENNISEKLAHQLGDGEVQRKYYTSLSALAGIKNVPLVLTKIYDFHNSRNKNRSISYKIVDEENFEFHFMEGNKKAI